MRGPCQCRATQVRFSRVLTYAASAHRQHIGMHQTRIQQFPDDQTRTACSLKLVHISTAIGVHMRQRGHNI